MPGHRAYLCLSEATEPLIRFGQSNGIPLARTSRKSSGSFSPQVYTAITITSKSWCIAHLYPHPESRHPCLSLRLRFAPTQLAHAHTWWICSDAVPRNTPHPISRHEQHPVFPETWLTFPLFLLQLPAFTAGIVLLLSIWGAKRSGSVTDPVREMEDVHKCMAVLQSAEGRCVWSEGTFLSRLTFLSFHRWHAAGRLWCVNRVTKICVFLVLTERYRDVLYELASVGDLPLPIPSPSAKRERDSDSPISLQSNPNANTSRGPAPPPQQAQPQRLSLSPAASSLGAGSSGTPFVDQLYSHPSEAFAQQRAPPDILSHPAQAQSFAYAHLPTHSDELARVPNHVFQTAPETWLNPHAHAHAHTHRHQPQHAAAPLYVPATASHHQQASYGTPPGAEAYTTFVAASSGGPALSGPGPGPGPQGYGQGQQDGNVDIWHTVPSGYEYVFPFHSGAGGAPRVGDWLIGGTGSFG